MSMRFIPTGKCCTMLVLFFVCTVLVTTSVTALPNSRTTKTRTVTTTDEVQNNNNGNLELLVYLGWEHTRDIDGNYIVTPEHQLDSVDLIIEDLERELGYEVNIEKICPGLGLTPHGGMSTIGKLIITNKSKRIVSKDLGIMSSVSEKEGKEEEENNNNAEHKAFDHKAMLDVISAKKLEQRLKQKISVMLDDTRFSMRSRRSILGYRGEDTLPRISNVIIERQIKFGAAIESDNGEEQELDVFWDKGTEAIENEFNYMDSYKEEQGQEQQEYEEEKEILTDTEQYVKIHRALLSSDDGDGDGEDEDEKRFISKREARLGSTKISSASSLSNVYMYTDDEDIGTGLIRDTKSSRSLLSKNLNQQPRRKPKYPTTHITYSTVITRDISYNIDSEVLVADGPLSQSNIDNIANSRWPKDRINQRNLPLDNKYTVPAYFKPATSKSIVFVLDTAIDVNHVEFVSNNGRVRMGWDAYEDDPDEQVSKSRTCVAHGNHVAGSIGGNTVGINPDAEIIGVRVLDCQGSGYTFDIIAGLLYVKSECMSRGGKSGSSSSSGNSNGFTINLSLSGYGDPLASSSGALANLMREISENCDAVFSIAAGNAANDTCMTIPGGYVNRQPPAHPSSSGTIITFGATDINDNFAPFSNYGPCVTLNAPGVSIISAGSSSTNSFVSKSGTSMATAIGSGVISLYYARKPSYWYLQHPTSLYGETIKNTLLSNAVTNAVKRLPNVQTTPRLIYVPPTPSSLSNSISAPVAHVDPSPFQLNSEIVSSDGNSFLGNLFYGAKNEYTYLGVIATLAAVLGLNLVLLPLLKP